MELGLNNKIAIVTGGTRGIGYAICEDLLLEGVIVVPFFRGDTSRFTPLMEWMTAHAIPQQNLVPLNVDINDAKALEEGVAAVMSKFGRIDILVNCAGITVESPFLLNDDETWAEIFNVNLVTVMRLSKLVLRPMIRAKSGAIINISPILGFCKGRGAVAYSASKAAINRFTESLATEVGKKGVRVNSVCPGIIDTKMANNLLTLHKDINDQAPLQRAGRPEEVAKAVLFLASQNTASFITGHNLVVDGGMSI